MNEPFRDYELDLDAKDKKREIAHGVLVFVALVTIASMFGCSGPSPYSPETQNAATLTPLTTAPEDSLDTNDPFPGKAFEFEPEPMDMDAWDAYLWSLYGVGR